MLFDINQYINASNFLTFNVGHGFFAGELLKRYAKSSDERKTIYESMRSKKNIL